MQVIIEQIVSQIRAFDSNLSQETIRRIVSAAVHAMRAEAQQADRIAEENSLQNYQQRNQPWRDSR